MSAARKTKLDVPPERWDRLFAPSSCLVVITTIDSNGRINAAPFGTCVRVCHEPVFIAFTVGAQKDTYHNVLETGEFVVNTPPFERGILERVIIMGETFPRGVNELEKAGLTAIQSKTLRAPRIEECVRHFECKVEWVKEWSSRLMVVGRLLAASVDDGHVDPDGFIAWDKCRPAHYCGREYGSKFVAAFETIIVESSHGEPMFDKERLRHQRKTGWAK